LKIGSTASSPDHHLMDAVSPPSPPLAAHRLAEKGSPLHYLDGLDEKMTVGERTEDGELYPCTLVNPTTCEVVFFELGCPPTIKDLHKTCDDKGCSSSWFSF
jgi:hypothetical protein